MANTEAVKPPEEDLRERLQELTKREEVFSQLAVSLDSRVKALETGTGNVKADAYQKSLNGADTDVARRLAEVENQQLQSSEAASRIEQRVLAFRENVTKRKDELSQLADCLELRVKALEAAREENDLQADASQKKSNQVDTDVAQRMAGAEIQHLESESAAVIESASLIEQRIASFQENILKRKDELSQLAVSLESRVKGLETAREQEDSQADASQKISKQVDTDVVQRMAEVESQHVKLSESASRIEQRVASFQENMSIRKDELSQFAVSLESRVKGLETAREHEDSQADASQKNSKQVDTDVAQRMAEVEHQHLKLSESASSIEQRVASFQEHMSKREDELSQLAVSLQSRVKELETAREQEDSQADTSQKRSKGVDTDMARRLAEVENHQLELSETASRIEQRVAAFRESTGKMKADASQKSSKGVDTDVARRLAEVEKQHRELSETASSMRQRVSAVECGNKDELISLAELGASMKKRIADLEGLHRRAPDLEQPAGNSQVVPVDNGAAAISQAEYESMRTRLSEYEFQNSQLQEELQRMEKAREDLEKLCEELDKRTSEFQDGVTSSSPSMEQPAGNSQVVPVDNGDAAISQADYESMRSRLSEYEFQNSQLQEELQRMEKVREDLERSCEELDKRASEFQAQLALKEAPSGMTLSDTPCRPAVEAMQVTRDLEGAGESLTSKINGLEELREAKQQAEARYLQECTQKRDMQARYLDDVNALRAGYARLESDTEAQVSKLADEVHQSRGMASMLEAEVQESRRICAAQQTEHQEYVQGLEASIAAKQELDVHIRNLEHDLNYARHQAAEFETELQKERKASDYETVQRKTALAALEVERARCEKLQAHASGSSSPERVKELEANNDTIEEERRALQDKINKLEANHEHEIQRLQNHIQELEACISSKDDEQRLIKEQMDSLQSERRLSDGVQKQRSLMVPHSNQAIRKSEEPLQQRSQMVPHSNQAIRKSEAAHDVNVTRPSLSQATSGKHEVAQGAELQKLQDTLKKLEANLERRSRIHARHDIQLNESGAGLEGAGLDPTKVKAGLDSTKVKPSSSGSSIANYVKAPIPRISLSATVVPHSSATPIRHEPRSMGDTSFLRPVTTYTSDSLLSSQGVRHVQPSQGSKTFPITTVSGAYPALQTLPEQISSPRGSPDWQSHPSVSERQISGAFPINHVKTLIPAQHQPQVFIRKSPAK